MSGKEKGLSLVSKVRRMERPYIIINCAASADGKIALPDKRQLRISSEEDFIRVQNLREKCDAVLVGIGTILTDDPKLNVKYDSKRQPAKVVLDRYFKTPPNAKIFEGGSKVYIMVGPDVEREIRKDNLELIRCKLDENGLIDLEFALKELKMRGINSLLVEGGGTVIWNFLKKRLFDEFYVYIAPIVIGGISTPTIADGEGVRREGEIIMLKIDKIEKVGEGILIKYLPGL